jgi:hypothetical protein
VGSESVSGFIYHSYNTSLQSTVSGATTTHYSSEFTSSLLRLLLKHLLPVTWHVERDSATALRLLDLTISLNLIMCLLRLLFHVLYLYLCVTASNNSVSKELSVRYRGYGLQQAGFQRGSVFIPAVTLPQKRAFRNTSQCVLVNTYVMWWNGICRIGACLPNCMASYTRRHLQLRNYLEESVVCR